MGTPRCGFCTLTSRSPKPSTGTAQQNRTAQPSGPAEWGPLDGTHAGSPRQKAGPSCHDCSRLAWAPLLLSASNHCAHLRSPPRLAPLGDTFSHALPTETGDERWQLLWVAGEARCGACGRSSVVVRIFLHALRRALSELRMCSQAALHYSSSLTESVVLSLLKKFRYGPSTCPPCLGHMGRELRDIPSAWRILRSGSEPAEEVGGC